jgi:hypothetical protein
LNCNHYGFPADFIVRSAGIFWIHNFGVAALKISFGACGSHSRQGAKAHPMRDLTFRQIGSEKIWEHGWAACCNTQQEIR